MTNQIPRKRRWFLLIAAAIGVICLLGAIGFAGTMYYFRNIRVSDPVPSVESSTLGTEMILTETDRGIENGKTVIFYKLKTSGLSPQDSFTLIYYPLGKEATMMGKVEINATGQVVDPNSYQEVEFRVYDFAKGERLLYGLISSDKKIQVFGKIVPSPIESTGENGCKVSVELGDNSGRGFVILGEGFVPQEILNYTSNSEGEIINGTINVQEDGKFRLFFFPAVIGKLSGKDEIQFVSQLCETAIEYEWGLPVIENKQ